MENIIVIVGPTGIGKTKLSIELAKKMGAEIINGDSVSIYKRLNIGSAKPTEEERENIPHHLIDIKDVDEEYTVYDYQRDVREKIKEITSRNKRIIIVGGTGLYIKAALFDYKFQKGTINDRYENLSNEEIIKKIKEYDISDIPDNNNRQRLVRLLNKLRNNEPISNNKDQVLYPVTIIGLTVDRETLYDRINNRVDLMIENGLLNEINSLKQYYKNSRVLNSGIGYKEFYSYLFADKSLEQVIDDIKLHSRRYAKRQYTFFRNQFNTNWFDVDLNNFEKTINQVCKYIESNEKK